MDELRIGMSNAEFVQWSIYWGRKAQREELARLKAGG